MMLYVFLNHSGKILLFLSICQIIDNLKLLQLIQAENQFNQFWQSLRSGENYQGAEYC